MESKTKLSKLKAILVPTIIMIVMGLFSFLPAGSFRFWQAWIWWLGFSVLTIFMTAYFLKKDPELLLRRSQNKEKETAQKIPAFLGKLNLFGYLIPGLDFRFLCSTVPFQE